jgi:hypothetical protein
MAAEFLRALYGTDDEVERSVSQLAEQIASDLRADVPLRDLPTAELVPHTPVYCDATGDFAPGQPRWRLYRLGELDVEVCEAMGRHHWDAIRATIEARLLETAAGALWFNVARPAPNTLAVVRPRLDALLARWADLAALEYFYKELHARPLDHIVEASYRDLLVIWDARGTGVLPDRLRVAIDRAAAASADETRAQLARALAVLAAREHKLRAPERFADQPWVEDQLATVAAKDYDAAVTGHVVKRLLFALDAR